MKKISPFLTPLFLLSFLILVSCGRSGKDPWADDFKHQPVSARPALEVSYTDGERTAFQVLAEDYQLTGQLTTPHLLRSQQGEEWLWMEITDKQGKVYSTRNASEKSRINLYRRGPYFCELHWFDIQPATAEGEAAPLKGDITLFCYPEKVLVEAVWHGTGEFEASKLQVKGIAPAEFSCKTFQDGKKQVFQFPLFGEEESLPDEAFTLVEGVTPLRYNARKGYYEIGTNTSSSFQDQHYDFPNRYETATFTIRNDETPRKIYIGHRSVKGGGIVEGGVVLDQEGHPMPLVVQVSKNFAGEKEEKFYNPLDTAFSETYFPLYLQAGESVTLSSLHLYQNWGRHMTKHWSSLGAWMDYFHSSTGVTETTCYVPFKFGGIGGVAIADFRAMSQQSFWRGQPQHDNIAGHSFLSYHDGAAWQHSKYDGTIYRSTGPNWFDIQMNYTSADGSVKVSADIWETPQVDELRSFFKVRYEVLKPLVIEDAAANFRFLTITSTIQQLRFTKIAATGLEAQEIDYSKTFPVKGHPLPRENAFLTKFGDHTRERGSNAIIIRSFTGPEGVGPAVSLQAGRYADRFRDAPIQQHKLNDSEEDVRLFLTTDVDRLELRPGDVFEIDGYWLPYGPLDEAETPERETETYANGLPRVSSCTKGQVIEHLPIKIKAENNKAEFSLRGGRDLVPVIISGLSQWKYPRIWKKEGESWRLLSHARNWAHDGYQVFSEGENSFGAVFLVHAGETEQQLRVRVGSAMEEEPQISLETTEDGTIAFGGVELAFPPAGDPPIWMESEGNSRWFESREGSWMRGGRINPSQDDVDLEYWWQVSREGLALDPPVFTIDLEGSSFGEGAGDRTWILHEGQWQKAPPVHRSTSGIKAIAVEDREGSSFLCLAWPRAIEAAVEENRISISLEPVHIAMKHRYHLRGKVYLGAQSLDILADRIKREITTR
jgi:hypothetical protein